ncbi:MAG: inositol monophosphatase family protein [Candidatus Izemoplasmatales bacterium]
MNYSKELNLLKNVVHTIFDKTLDTIIQTHSKGIQDIVTSTDLFIEKKLVEAIKKNFPEDFFHTEEYHHKTHLKDRTWLIDPIDGTSNYARKLDLFVVQIALYDKGDIVLSYIYAPLFKQSFYAIKNQGAYLNDERYEVGHSKSETFMISMVGLTHDNESKEYYNKIIDYGVNHRFKLRMLGSIGLELALASYGIFDLFYTNESNYWDIFPGLLLLREAGAILLNEQGKTYQINDKNLFVCKNEKVKDILINHIL